MKNLLHPLFRKKRPEWSVAAFFLTATTLAQTPQGRNSPETFPVFAQKITQQTTQNRTEAYRFAEKNGWFLRRTDQTGRVFALTGLDSLGRPVYLSTHAAPITLPARLSTHVDALHPGGSSSLALSGATAVTDRLGLWDGGTVRASHREFNGGRIVPQTAGAALSDHATHLAGVLVARGAGTDVKGMAFGARLKTGDFTDDLAEMTAAAPGLLVSNHSYGLVAGWVLNPDRPGTDPARKWEWWGDETLSKTEDYKFGFYDQKAHDYDALAYRQPQYLIVKSADNKRGETGPPTGTLHFLRNTNATSTATRSPNSGYDVLPADATAKNILTVGAVFPTDATGIVRLTDFSGWGPTDDGRVKPDLMGVGVGITSSTARTDDAYATLTGTSVAAPNVAGALLLLQELAARLRSSQFLRAATLKTLALHTARDLALPGPDYQTGWGLLDARAAAAVLTNERQNHFLLESTLRQGEVFTKTIYASGTGPLTVTLGWSDPEGAATPLKATSVNSRIPKLVNDLDLRIFHGTGEALPYTLDPFRPEAAAQPGDNLRDNVEQVVIARPVPGQEYTIRIRHKNSLQNGAQLFSLLASGLDENCGIQARVTTPDSALLCSGKSVRLLAATNPAYGYQWQRNGSDIRLATTPTYTTDQPGAYRVLVRRETCTLASAALVLGSSNVQAKVTPSGPLALSASTALVLRATTGAGYTHQWLRDNADLPAATAASLVPTQPGRYAVRVSAGGCALTSAAVLVTGQALVLTGLESPPSISPMLQLSPNPTNGWLTVDFSSSEKILDLPLVTVFGLSGAAVLSRPLSAMNEPGRFSETLDLRGLPAGMYLLRVQHGGTGGWKRVVRE